MSGWNEDSFLERLMPQPPPNPGGKQNSCPDAETLCAVMEGETSGPLRDAVLEHLRQCTACADVQHRLLNFDLGGEPEGEAEWQEARSRLDNWVARLLGWDAVPVRPANRAEPSRPVLGWKHVPKALFDFKVQWALGMAAVILLVLAIDCEHQRTYVVDQRCDGSCETPQSCPRPGRRVLRRFCRQRPLVSGWPT